MGVPIKLSVNDQTVFICCQGCETRLRRDPETYLQAMRQIDKQPGRSAPADADMPEIVPDLPPIGEVEMVPMERVEPVGGAN